MLCLDLCPVSYAYTCAFGTSKRDKYIPITLTPRFHFKALLAVIKTAIEYLM